MTTLSETIKNHLLSGMVLTFRRVHDVVNTLSAYTEEEKGDGVRMVYETQNSASAGIDVKNSGGTVMFSIDAPIVRGWGTSSAFLPEKAVSLTLGDMQPEALVCNYHDNPWWMLPSHGNTFAEIPAKTQGLLILHGGKHYHILPLCGDNFRCEIEGDTVSLTSDTSALQRLSGAFLAVTEADDPFTAVRENYENARACGAVRVPLRTERKFPEIFEGFGFCTWDCFYKNITSEKLYEKMDEFKEKNIPVRWVMLDNGWLSNDGNMMLTDFEENREKFPEGLRGTIRRLKEDYGVRYVGVWHTFSGFWEGVLPGSKLYEEQKANLITTPGGFCLPGPDEEHAFRFWDTWHGYLADCGVDFLKVDSQSSHSGHILGVLPTVEGCRISHSALERSIDKHFGGIVINCMGMDMENVLSRPRSAVNRNSDDFFPKRERGFIKHLIQNAYNAVWHGQMYHCDYDMWWSDHESAVQSGVLRAISGSPVYVSDEVGRSRRETIMPLITEDGMIMRCDGPAVPTLDCVYTDCPKEDKLLKIRNRSGDCFGLAAFNVSDHSVTDTVDFGAIPDLPDGDFMAYEYFSKTWQPITRKTVISLSLPKDDTAVWSIYPVMNPGTPDAFIMAGDESKYLPIAAKDKKKMLLSELH
ncbi:MAG: alpha-galactosidase [Clostridia bacterium]|nr:alpha-galactosidase [Clostridia bacterium]